MIIGSGVAISETRNVPAFKAIDVTGSFEVTAVCQAATQKVEVSGDDNIVPVIKTNVDGDVLRIFSDEGFSTNLKLQIVIATANVEKLQLKGSGSGQLSEVANNTVDLMLDGSGTIAAKGTTQVAKISLSGSGRIKAANLHAEDVDVSVTGSGRAEVHARVKLVAEVSGSGTIIYSGNPQSVSKKITGSGSIIQN